MKKMKNVYLYKFSSKDEDGENTSSVSKIDTDLSPEELAQQCVSFLSQTDNAYIDKFGIVHEIYDGIDQLYAYYFVIEHNDWYKLIGDLGQWLDDDNDIWNADNEAIRQGIEEMYEFFLPIAEGKTLIQE